MQDKLKLNKPPHIPIMLNEILSAFKGLKEGVIIDATVGFGGHSEALLNANEKIKLIACDQDLEALSFARQRLAKFKDRAQFHHCNFSRLLQGIDTREVKGIVADLGVSSWQLDRDERGFSVNSNTLDMRMNPQSKTSAFDLVNYASQSELEGILKDFGELKEAKNLAFKICQTRKGGQIQSGKDLAKIIGFDKLSGRNVSKAVLVFQALRIAVNDELNALQSLLTSIKNARLSGCLVAIICFHSLEDRLVKNAFKEWAKSCICPKFALRCTCQNNHNLGKILTKKPLRPSEAELSANSRSSSAKLRLFRFNEV